MSEQMTENTTSAEPAGQKTVPEHVPMPEHPVAILFDIDGTLIISGGAGAASWRMAFDELHGIPADIGQFTDNGMTDPDVGRKTFEAVLHREPSRTEFAKLLERRSHYLFQTVAESSGYHVLDGVEDLLLDLMERDYLLGLITGNLETAAHIKLHRGRLNRFFSFGGYGSDSNDRGEVVRTALRRASVVYGQPLDPSQAFAIGDTPHDAAGAHKANMACVGVASHNFTKEQLTEGNADYVIGSLTEGLPVPPNAP